MRRVTVVLQVLSRNRIGEAVSIGGDSWIVHKACGQSRTHGRDFRKLLRRCRRGFRAFRCRGGLALNCSNTVLIDDFCAALWTGAEEAFRRVHLALEDFGNGLWCVVSGRDGSPSSFDSGYGGF